MKNRPFYTGDPVETVFVEATTIPFEDTKGGFYAGNFASTFVPTVGESYKVSWDGTVHECICKDFNGLAAIGNFAIVGFGSDSGEPFIIGQEGPGALTIATADTASSHVISISGIATPVVKIDEKYLPDTVATKSDVEDAAENTVKYTTSQNLTDAQKQQARTNIGAGTSSFSGSWNDLTGKPIKPTGESYLTFRSPNSFTLAVKNTTKRWDGTLEYFTSNGTWTTWNANSILSAIPYYSEYVLYLRGTGNTIITGNISGSNWVLTGTDIKCIGNIENLLDYATVESGAHPTLADHCYYCLFLNCTSLTQVPALPATTLADHCYYQMFLNCTSLTQAPTLPATTLADHCYNEMFRGCAGLKLSTTLTNEYTQEYRIPSSGNGTTASNALSNMFTSTGGTFTGTPSINTTYYLSSDNMVVRETEIATLNGYVGSMINNAISEHADTAEYIIHSSTEGSTKKFRITVDDSGVLAATEVT